MNPDFFVAVRVSAIGMALVFLTLIICALVILALGALFKPKPAEAAAEAPLIDPTALEPPVPAPNWGDEAAAIALAIAATLASRKQKVAAPVAVQPQITREWAPSTVVVLSLDAGTGNWNSAGKIKSTS